MVSVISLCYSQDHTAYSHDCSEQLQYSHCWSGVPNPNHSRECNYSQTWHDFEYAGRIHYITFKYSLTSFLNHFTNHSYILLLASSFLVSHCGETKVERTGWLLLANISNRTQQSSSNIFAAERKKRKYVTNKLVTQWQPFKSDSALYPQPPRNILLHLQRSVTEEESKPTCNLVPFMHGCRTAFLCWSL